MVRAHVVLCCYGGATVAFHLFLLSIYPVIPIAYSEAVDAMIYHNVAKTRWEAVQLGRRLAREHRLFKHSCDDHEFRDEFLFYRYNELDENGVESSLGSAMSGSGGLKRPKSEIAQLADAFEMYVDIRYVRYHRSGELAGDCDAAQSNVIS